MDIVKRLMASSCSENCLMGKAAKEIERLRRIEAAAWKVVAVDKWGDEQWQIDMVALDVVVRGVK